MNYKSFSAHKQKTRGVNVVNRVNSLYKICFCILLVLSLTYMFNRSVTVEPAYSSHGSTGREVEEVQRVLKEWGLFKSEITGYFGSETQAAITKFQKLNGLPQTGAADAATLKKMGISIGTIPSATDANVYLLARIISAEGRGESYTGQVAIGAVICNRIEHPSFPDTLQGVIYQDGAFTALVDGQFNEPISDSAYSAARDALAGWDPSGGAIYYYNPAKTSNAFIYSRQVIKVIGSHRFCI